MQATWNRQAALERLVAHALAAIHQDDDHGWLRLILRRGFVGFENMPEAQLRKELAMRGLEAEADDVEADLGEDDGWDVEEIAGLRREGLTDLAG